MKPKLTSWQSMKNVDEYFGKVAKDALEMNQQQNAYDAAIHCGRRLTHALHVAQVQQANEALIEMKREKERLQKEYDLKVSEEMLLKLAKTEQQQLEKVQLQRLKKQANVQEQLEQVRKRKEMADKKKQEEKREDERQRFLYQKYVEKNKKQDIIKANKKKSDLMQRLQEISDQQLKKEMELRKQKAEDERIERVSREMEEQKRPEGPHEMIRQRQIRTEIVSQKLEAMKKEQAAIKDVRKQKLELEIRSYDAKNEKQRKEKEAKRAADLKEITSYRKIQVKRKEEKKIEDESREIGWIEAQRLSDLMYETQQKEKAQRKRRANIEASNINVAMAAQKCTFADQIRRDKQHSALKTAREADNKQQLQQKLQSDLLLAAGFKKDKIPQILGRSTGGPGLLMDKKDDGYNCSLTNEPLPRMSTSQTRFIKLCHERGSLLPMQNKERFRLPAITTKPYQERSKLPNAPFLPPAYIHRPQWKL